MSEVLKLTKRMEEHATDIEQALAVACGSGLPDHQRQVQRALDLRVSAKLLRNFASGVASDSSWLEPLLLG